MEKLIRFCLLQLISYSRGAWWWVNAEGERSAKCQIECENLKSKIDGTLLCGIVHVLYAHLAKLIIIYITFDHTQNSQQVHAKKKMPFSCSRATACEQSQFEFDCLKNIMLCTCRFMPIMYNYGQYLCNSTFLSPATILLLIIQLPVMLVGFLLQHSTI